MNRGCDTLGRVFKCVSVLHFPQLNAEVTIYLNFYVTTNMSSR